MTGIAGVGGGRSLPRGLEVALFVASMIWAGTASVIAGRAAAGIAGRLGLAYGQSFLEGLFLLFLAVVGFRALDAMATSGARRGEVLRLPLRGSWKQEWLTGAAIGWGLCVAVVLPVVLSGRTHAVWNRGAGVVPGVLVGVGTVLVWALAEEVIFRGYPYLRLRGALSTKWAALAMSLVFAGVLVGLNPPGSYALAMLDSTLFGVLLTLAYLRTHALWVGWGVHFGYRVVMAVVLGLPVAGRTEVGSLVTADLGSPRWLTGGGFGLDAALFTAVMLAVAWGVLYRVTRDWAWEYTTPEIVAAGYAVEVAPPAAHVAMEKTAAAAPPPLVQIQANTAVGFSAEPGITAVPPPPIPRVDWSE